MTSAVFHFILGLTLGILIALVLINRYHLGDRNFNRDSNISELARESSSMDINPSISDIVTGAINLRSNSTLGNDAESADRIAVFGGKTGGKSSTSFWVPGTKGAYLKFMNHKSDADIPTPAVAEPAKIEPADSKPAVAEKLADFFAGDGEDLKDKKRGTKIRYGSGSAMVGSFVARGKGGAAEALLRMEQGEDLQREAVEQDKEEQAPADPDLGPLGAGQRGSGKRKRGQKGVRGGRKGSKDAAVDIVPPAPQLGEKLPVISPATKANDVSVTTGVSAGDDLNVQQQFFTISGERVDPHTVKPPAGEKIVVLYDHPPLLPYHSQARSKAPLSPPYVPSLASVIAQRAVIIHHADVLPGGETVTNVSYASSLNGHPKPLPNMAQQKGVSEPEHLQLHMCNAVFEAYSGSYLTTKQHMLNVASESFNLTWVNCEMASFIHMKESRKFFAEPYSEGLVVQSLDVLDFSVIHLSAFERSSKKYRYKLWTDKEDLKTEWTKIEAVKEAARILDAKNNPKKSADKIIWSDEANRTVAIMPFLGGAMGAGHSELGNRFDYLKACFWSLYEFIPHIVAGVSRQEDVDWCWEESGLPFYDVLLLDIPKGAGLPVATTQRTKQKLQSGEWPFDYVFFTESDQILIARTMPMMYDHLRKYPGRMILPHRLMPYSKEVVTTIHKKNIVESPLNAWMNQSCCMERTNCQNRKGWKELKDPAVAMINYYGLYVPLGNVNFLMETYRTCTMSPHIGDYCP